jgi:hypothetical protein
MALLAGLPTETGLQAAFDGLSYAAHNRKSESFRIQSLPVGSIPSSALKIKYAKFHIQFFTYF